MATNDLTYLNNDLINIERPLTLDEQVAIHKGEKTTTNFFEEYIKKKTQQDFEEFLVSNEAVKVERKIRELEKQGHIVFLEKPKTINYEISPMAKSFIAGLLTGIGLMILLL